MKENDLVTLRSFTDPVNANVLKSMLESEGIECCIFDENTIGMNYLYSNAIGGVKVKVKQSDMERASRLVEEMENENIEKTPADDTGSHCPHCGSSNIESLRESSRRLNAMSILLLGFPVVYPKSGYRCNECKKGWDKSSPLVRMVQFLFYLFVIGIVVVTISALV